MGQVLEELSLGPPSGNLGYNLDNYIKIKNKKKIPIKNRIKNCEEEKEGERKKE